MKLFLIVIFIFFSNLSYSQNIKELPYWLEGLWILESESSIIYEKWEISENTLLGKTFSIFDNDTIIFKEMQIKYKQNDIILDIYIPFSSNSSPTIYSLSEKFDNFCEFEAINDIFPKKIKYTNISANSIHLSTEPVSEDYMCIDFLMIKKNE